MAYKQPYNSTDKPKAKAEVIDMSTRKGRRQSNRQDKTMKVRIKPGKEGELSDYAMDHITKTNRKGKATIEVPKSEMNSSKSKLFKTSKPKWTSNPNADPPSSRSTAKGFKKQRNKDRVLKAVAGTLVGSLLGGGAAISSLQNKGPMALVKDKFSRRNKRKNKKAKQYTEEITGVKEKKEFKGYSEKEMRDPNAPKTNNNKSGCGKGGLFNTRFGGCFDGGKSAYR